MTLNSFLHREKMKEDLDMSSQSSECPGYCDSSDESVITDQRSDPRAVSSPISSAFSIDSILGKKDHRISESEVEFNDKSHKSYQEFKDQAHVIRPLAISSNPANYFYEHGKILRFLFKSRVNPILGHSQEKN